MANCPILYAPSEDGKPCIKNRCEWWIKHDGKYGCAVVKIVPELSELRKWIAIKTWGDSA